MTVADTRRPIAVPGGPARPRTVHLRAVGLLIGAVVTAAVVASVGLFVIGRVEWPAFNSSNVTGALTTAGQAVAIAILVIAAVLYRMSRSPLLVHLLGWVGISGFTTVTLAMPLGATRLYLFGISVDQQFRTEYLTRLTDTHGLADMTYRGLAPYYPAGWFWLGGRYANAVSEPAWAAFKPWSIITLAVAATIALALWSRMIRTDRAIAVTLATAALTIYYAGPEPYAAVLIMVGAPMLVTILHGLRSGSVPALVAGGLFLGVSATFYTLFTGLFALSAVLMALWLIVDGVRSATNTAVPTQEIRRRRLRIALVIATRLIGMGVLSGLVALLVWAPYLAARVRSEPASGGTAEHYLPSGGATLPVPMLQLNLIGLLCAIGLVWILMRLSTRTVALALGVTTVALYLFCLLSMAVTAIGTTLLAFRLEPVLAVVLGAAGVFGVVELARLAVGRFGDVRTGVVVVALIGAIGLSQGIPSHLSGEITTAYTDTDGDGVRADKRPPGAESYFPRVDDLIRQQTGRARDDTVVLTADYGFLSIYPYWGFQGLTSHYANPLAEFDKRAATIERWSTITTPQAMIAALDASPWQPPSVFLFRYSADGYALRLAADVYPNDPNVKRYTVTFAAAAFADPRFTVTEVGPFVLVVRR
ncbi:galactan 5-O-arabinofuranosyltransferase [Williamsia deligens]|uniref:Galactan 5-O-arabinofuranosyltransferase n=1 Tax=Williamsia deligens TaxID=321325 RepID=A0ABW3G8P6_9NOCA|nr:galactan 5-O-arabinofuranosyltransferase [Williamsia deligens]MCP2193982.1 galactan 5-O-arabinofuranosyltransferase [Williamsia deligens]